MILFFCELRLNPEEHDLAGRAPLYPSVFIPGFRAAGADENFRADARESPLLYIMEMESLPVPPSYTSWIFFPCLLLYIMGLLIRSFLL